MQAFKRCHLVSDAAVQLEQVSQVTSNLTISRITHPQSPLQTQSAWIWPLPFKPLLSCMQTHPSFRKCEEESLLLKSLHLVLPNSFSSTAPLQLLLTAPMGSTGNLSAGGCGAAPPGTFLSNHPQFQACEDVEGQSPGAIAACAQSHTQSSCFLRRVC